MDNPNWFENNDLNNLEINYQKDKSYYHLNILEAIYILSNNSEL